MVYTTQRIRVIPKPGDQPISIGEGEATGGTGGIPAIGALNNLLQQLFPGYRPIDFPAPSTVSDGGIPDVVGPGGGGATGSGLGEGEIVKVEVPSSAASGSTFLIKSTFKNKSASTQNFSLRILISPLGINTVTPTVSLTAGQQSIIESTIILPNVQYGGNFPGAVELRSVTGTNVILFQDSEAFTLAVVGSGTTSGGPAAAITPSATFVMRGTSISINCINFGASEVIDFVAKVGTTVVATDTKSAGTNGAAVLNTLTFSSSSPTGIAVITATGRTTGKIATTQVTVTLTATGVATILPSATTVQQGKSVAIACSNFLAGEIVDIVAKVGTTTVATDNHPMGTTGSGTEPDLTFSTSSPLGTAVITGKGRVSLRTATASVTVLAATTTTSAKIVPSKTSVVRGTSISITCTNFGASERIDFTAKVGTTTVATDNKTTGSNGSVVLDTLTFSSSSPTGTATITAKGATTGRIATATVTVTSSTSTTTASISAPSSVHDGDTFTVTGKGFQGGEKVTTKVSGTWHSSNSTYNNKTFSASTTVTASSSGTFAVNVKTPEVPSGVSTTATIKSTGLTSGRTASRTISVI